MAAEIIVQSILPMAKFAQLVALKTAAAMPGDFTDFAASIRPSLLRPCSTYWNCPTWE